MSVITYNANNENDFNINDYVEPGVMEDWNNGDRADARADILIGLHYWITVNDDLRAELQNNGAADGSLLTTTQGVIDIVRENRWIEEQIAYYTTA